MIGLAALGLTVIMIYTLVKNALLGAQLNALDSFEGKIDVLIPIQNNSSFYFDAWEESLAQFKNTGSLRIHFMIDGHYPRIGDWENLKTKYSHIEIHNFLMRPSETETIPWMIEQISKNIKAEIIIIGDAQSVANEAALISIAHHTQSKQSSLLILPQTAKLSILGEAVAVLNPTLALASIFGFHKFRKNLSHPLMSLCDGWISMDQKTFSEVSFAKLKNLSWREGLSRQWDEKNKNFQLIFGEKFLRRFYSKNFTEQFEALKQFWPLAWKNPDHLGTILYMTTLFLWAFPFIFLLTNPIWSTVGFFLLIIYRFFTKIVFQESWSALFLHPVAGIILIASCLQWILLSLKAKIQKR